MRFLCGRVVAVVLLTLLSLANSYAASAAHRKLEHLVDQNSREFIDTSKKIWQYAELGYHETQSSALLQQDLKAAGFAISPE